MRVWRSPLLFLWSLSAFAERELGEEDVARASSRADRIRGALLGALTSDALCLGSHYEYDAGAIRQAYAVSDGASAGEQTFGYMAPGERMGGTTHGVGWGRRNYHPGQKKGDQTDYGEYNMLNLEYLAKRSANNAIDRPIDLDDYVGTWKKRLGSDAWGAWRCTMTKQALEQTQRGVRPQQLGGNSNAMAMRSAAVFGVFRDEDLAARASDTLMFTHKHPHALIGGEFFTRVAHKIVFGDGVTPATALRTTCAEMGAQGSGSLASFVKAQCDKGFAKFEEVQGGGALSEQPAAVVDDLAMTSMARLWDVGKSEPIKVGKASPTEGTMPSVIYMLLKYEKQGLAAAARANALVGGDSASRAVAIGMVLGAYYGAEGGLPGDLKRGLNHWKRAERLLDRLPLVQDAKEEL